MFHWPAPGLRHPCTVTTSVCGAARTSRHHPHQLQEIQGILKVYLLEPVKCCNYSYTYIRTCTCGARSIIHRLHVQRSDCAGRVPSHQNPTIQSSNAHAHIVSSLCLVCQIHIVICGDGTNNLQMCGYI